MKKSPAVHILIGSLLFGMFFGAGNLIFPVFVGQQAGSNTLWATTGFLITATGLPFLGVVAMALTDSKSTLEFGSRVHPVFGYIMAVLLFLTIGPFFALPRTATVSFEVGLTPILPPERIPLALAIFTVLFFSLALFFSLRPARILDWIGKILNPLFLLFITFLFLKALLAPMGQVSTPPPIGAYAQRAFSIGFIAGYQTMDVLAALAFGGIVLAQIRKVGYNTPKELATNTALSGLVTLLLMCVIYSGLTWLGATSRGLFDPSANGGLALAQISRHYFGRFGSVFLTITITIACLKTAIGLVTSCSQAFVDMFPKTFSYKTYCFIFAIFSCLVANVGLTQIISLAMPMLMLLYPPATILVLLSLFEPLIGNHRPLYLGGVLSTLVVAVVDALNALPSSLSSIPAVVNLTQWYKDYVPLFKEGFGWILPAAIGLLIGLTVVLVQKKKLVKNV